MLPFLRYVLTSTTVSATVVDPTPVAISACAIYHIRITCESQYERFD